MIESELTRSEILGVSAGTTAIREFARRAAQEDTPVLLCGEPGTGKQLAAQHIHAASSRRAGPFVIVDCSLYYERELKRELFGYGGPGAAAKERMGLLQFADGGTCYLAHVEELTPAIGRALAGYAVGGKFRRLGDGKEAHSSARLIVSSDKNLEGFVRSGLVDPEFFTRVCAVRQFFAPLRERREDIPALVESLASRRESGRELRVGFDPSAVEALQCYPWPRNFDELLKEIERLLESGAATVRPEQLAMEIGSYWLGQRGDPETRKVLEELDGYIREFKILSRIGCEFGDPTLEGKYALGEPERDLLEEY